MKAFAYTAFTASGDRRKGLVVAETETDAARQLSAQGLYVAELAFREGGGGARARLTHRALLNHDLRTVFTRQMSVLLNAEMPVEAALEAVRQDGDRALDTVLLIIAAMTRTTRALLTKETLIPTIQVAREVTTRTVVDIVDETIITTTTSTII